MTALRGAVAVLVLAVALVVQVSVFSAFAWDGIVPNLCLLVVVGAALVRGARFATLLGFAGGLLLDLAPPADHVAGRWALALMVVGYVAGRMRTDVRPGLGQVVATVASCSFVGTSIYALSGLLLGDPGAGIGELLTVILVSVVWDVALTPLVLPPLMRLFARLEPARAHA